MSWAWGSGTIANHGSNVGAWAFRINDDFTIDIIDGTSVELDGGTSTNWYRIHGICLYCLWGIFSFVMIITGRHLRYFYNLRIILHATCGTIILIMNMIFVWFASKESVGVVVTNKLAHVEFGKGMYAFVSAAWISGPFFVVVYFIFFFLRKINWRHYILVKFFRFVHWVLGYLAIIWSMWTMLSGLYSYGSKVKNLMFVHWAGYVIAWIVLEFIHCLRATNWKYGKSF